MNKKSDNLTHDEIWDDSTLVNSWNEALDEYKKYHSIYAKGGKLKDLEKLALDERTAESHIQGHDTKDGSDDAEAEERSSTGGGAGLEDQASKAGDAGREPLSNSHPQAAPAPAFFPPQLVMGTVRDENLKKLLMSWYYAGYYTGLYEGQQQAANQQGGKNQENPQ